MTGGAVHVPPLRSGLQLCLSVYFRNEQAGTIGRQEIAHGKFNRPKVFNVQKPSSASKASYFFFPDT